MNDRQKAVSVRVTGRVQGVGFRAWTWRRAEMRGLRGWVRNELDGSVSAFLAGMADEVDAMLAELQQGPSGALVRGVATAEADPQDAPPDFHVAF